MTHAFLDPARPRFLARPDVLSVQKDGETVDKLTGLYIEVYVAENAVRKGDRGKLGDIKVDGPGSFRSGAAKKEITATFNWSAWGEQAPPVVEAVSEAFIAVQELIDSIVGGVVSFELVLETYGVRAWQAAGK